MEKPLNAHQRFVLEVNSWRDDFKRYAAGNGNLEKLNEMRATRVDYTITALQKIANGGHGPTWAKSILKLYI